MATDRDGSRQSARSIGELGLSGFSRRDSLSTSQQDFIDYYKFRVSSSSQVTLNLRGLRDDANLILLNSAGRVLTSPRKLGKRPETITRNLDIGNYFVAVSLFGNQTPYSLQASAVPLAVPGDGGEPGTTPTPSPSPSPTPGSTIPTIPGTGQPNQTLPSGPSPIVPTDPGSIPGTAFAIGALDTTKVYRNKLGGVDANQNGVLERDELDPADYYSFTVNAPTKVKILTGNVSGGSVNTALVYDLNNNGAVDANDVLESSNTIQKSLGRGTYFIGVDFASGSDITYDLRVEQTPITDLDYPAPSDPFIGLGGARNLGILPNATATNIRQFVGSSDSTDIYQFSVLGQANVFSLLLDTTQLTGNITASLIYDADGNGIANPTRKAFNSQGEVVTTAGDFVAGTFTGGGTGGSALVLTEMLGQGTYFVAITQKGIADNTVYDLSLFANAIALTPGTDPAATLGSATTVTPLDARNGANYDPVNYQQFTQFVGATDGKDTYRFTLTETRNMIVSFRGSPTATSLRLVRDWNNNGAIDQPEDGTGSAAVNGSFVQFGSRNGRLDSEDTLIVNGSLDFEDINGNGDLDPGEDINGNGQLDTEDINGNGIFDTEDLNGNRALDRNEVFEPEPTINTQLFGLPPVEYNPLPPYPKPANDGFDFTEAFDDLRNAYVTSVPTVVYAKLAAGTYFFQVDATGNINSVNLGDGVERLGPGGNSVYNLSFFLEP